MTQIDTSTAAIEALLKDVTPGPWTCNEHSHVLTVNVGAHGGYQGRIADVVWWGNGHKGVRENPMKDAAKANYAFIAAARELVPALLAERDALKAEVVKLRAERNHANDVTDAAVDEIERLKAQAVTVKPVEQICVVNCGLPAEQCACYRDMMATPLSAITTRSEDEVWNEAIEAAVNEIDCGGCYGACLDPSNCRTDDVVAIRSLKRPIKGESLARQDIRNQPNERTALDRMLAEAREKALREAAAMVGYKAHIIRAAIPTPAKGGDHE